MQQKHLKRKGMSLLEIIISIAVYAVLALLLAEIMTLVNSTIRSTEQLNNRLNYEAKFADNLLTNEAAIRAVCEYQPTTARGIRDYIKKLLDKLGGKNNTLEKAVAMYNKALKDVAAKAQANAENRLKLPKTQQGRAQESGLKLGGTKTQYSAEEKQREHTAKRKSQRYKT